jgi:hypothetical protein
MANHADQGQEKTTKRQGYDTHRGRGDERLAGVLDEVAVDSIKVDLGLIRRVRSRGWGGDEAETELDSTLGGRPGAAGHERDGEGLYMTQRASISGPRRITDHDARKASDG